MAQANSTEKIRSRTSLLTKHLVFGVTWAAIGCFIYGYDGTSMSGMQALPSFLRSFGTYNPKTGTYALSPHDTSVLNSLAYLGKGVGALAGSPIVERFGHKWGFVVLSIVGIVGAIIQITSHSLAQFSASRVVLYTSIGLIETVLGTYQAELTPAPLRGMMVSTLQLMQSPGGLLASGMNRAFYRSTKNRVWVIPCSLQIIWPSIVLAGAYWLPASPRWLIANGQKEKALATLKKLRTKDEVAAGNCEEELEALEQDVAQRSSVKASWLDLFKGTNLRRTLLVCGVFTFQQVTGQTFVSTYAVPFWISAGLGDSAFNYSLGLSSAGLVGVVVGSQCYDRIGRRPILLFGSAVLFCIFICIAAIGSSTNPYTHSKGLGMVALVILFAPFFVATWGALSYIVGAELGTGALREKTMAFGCAVNVIWQFATTYVTPYWIADIGPKVGFIYAGILFLSFVWTYLYLPETKNRTLEEIDEMFEAKLPARKFKTYQCVGIGGKLHELEEGKHAHEPVSPGVTPLKIAAGDEKSVEEEK